VMPSKPLGTVVNTFRIAIPPELAQNNGLWTGASMTQILAVGSTAAAKKGDCEIQIAECKFYDNELAADYQVEPNIPDGFLLVFTICKDAVEPGEMLYSSMVMVQDGSIPGPVAEKLVYAAASLIVESLPDLYKGIPR
jgi:hypothetical protein